MDKSKTLHLDRGTFSLGLNQQLFDIGVPPRKLSDAKRAYNIALGIIKNFDFVMIAEQFDESMILLAEFLCWPLEDVAGFRNNALPANKKVTLNVIWK